MNLILGTTFVASLLVWVASRLSRRNAEAGNAVWRMAVLSFLVLPAVTALTHLYSSVWNTELGLFPKRAVVDTLARAGLDRPRPAPFERALATSDSTEAGSGRAPAPLAAAEPTGSTVGERLRAARTAVGNAWRSVFGTPRPARWAVWLVGVLLGLSWMIRDCWWVRWLVYRGARPCPGSVAVALKDVATGSGLRSPPRCVLSARMPVPVVVGLLRPRLALPETFDLSAPGARAVLAHEVGHVARRDPWWALVGRLAKVVWWWHPIAHIAAAELRRTAELACDDRAVRMVEDRVGLAGQIAEGAERTLGLAVSAYSDNPRHLRKRVARLLSGTAVPAGLSRRAGKAIGVAAFLTLAFLGCVRIAKNESRWDSPAYPSSGTYHLLFVGTDSRGLADAVFVGLLGFETGRAAVVAIDRDLLVPQLGGGPEGAGAMKISALLATSAVRLHPPSDPEQRRAPLARLVGLEFDGEVRWNIATLNPVLDRLGKLTVEVDKPMKYVDLSQNLVIDLQPGRQELGPDGIAGYLRFRQDKHGRSPYASGSAARTEHQLEFLRIAHKAILDMRERNETTRLQLLATVLANLDTDGAAKPSREEMRSLLRFASEVQPENLRTAVITGRPGTDKRLGYNLVPDSDEARAKVSEVEAWVEGR